jgi:hypothetical protein
LIWQAGKTVLIWTEETVPDDLRQYLYQDGDALSVKKKEEAV